MLAQFRASVSGMTAQQLTIDTISNNLANMNTTGFKASKVDFGDLLYQQEVAPGDYLPPSASPVDGVVVGGGVRPIGTKHDFSQGPLIAGQEPLNMAVEGDGFFIVRQPDGSAAFTRDGSFRVDAGRRLVTADGSVLQPEVIVPLEASDFYVADDGIVFAQMGENGPFQQIGEVQLARFPNPEGLLPIGENLSVATTEAGQVEVGFPGQRGFGKMHGGVVESSNLDIAGEMTNMVLAQRAYQMNARALQTIDEMLGMATSLRA